MGCISKIPLSLHIVPDLLPPAIDLYCSTQGQILSLLASDNSPDWLFGSRKVYPLSRPPRPELLLSRRQVLNQSGEVKVRSPGFRAKQGPLQLTAGHFRKERPANAAAREHERANLRHIFVSFILDEGKKW